MSPELSIQKMCMCVCVCVWQKERDRADLGSSLILPCTLSESFGTLTSEHLTVLTSLLEIIAPAFHLWMSIAIMSMTNGRCSLPQWHPIHCGVSSEYSEPLHDGTVVPVSERAFYCLILGCLPWVFLCSGPAPVFSHMATHWQFTT